MTVLLIPAGRPHAQKADARIRHERIRSARPAALPTGRGYAVETARRWLERTAWWLTPDRPAGELPYGPSVRLEIASAMFGAPSLGCSLDERRRNQSPANRPKSLRCGPAPRPDGRERAADRERHERGKPHLDHVVVLAYGRKRAEGPPAKAARPFRFGAYPAPRKARRTMLRRACLEVRWRGHFYGAISDERVDSTSARARCDADRRPWRGKRTC